MGFEVDVGFGIGRYRAREGWRMGRRGKQGHGNGHGLAGVRVVGVFRTFGASFGLYPLHSSSLINGRIGG